jgi:signal peptidase I
MDFATILTLAVLITGLIWAVDALFFAGRRRSRLTALRAQGAEETQLKRAVHGPVIVEYARTFFPVLMVVLLVRSFLVEPFRIPSGSMMPTLLVGDFILVNKFAYGLRLPVLNTRFVEIGSPQRGDVVVFRYPENPSVDYIKRVVGLPGDQVAYFNKTLYVNGQRVEQQPLQAYQGPQSEMVPGALVRLEALQDAEHEIMVQPWKPSLEGEFTVPAGQYFVMGDNRDNSNDSRYWGTVPEDHLVGRAFLIWMNWNASAGGFARERIGMTIK